MPRLTPPVLIAVMGPTGSGKSHVAEALAREIDAQLINADAFQVYRGLDIGTNKPDPHDHYALIDIKEPHDSYGVGEFVLDAISILETLFEQGRSAVLVGGTGLYIRALMEEYSDLHPLPAAELRDRINLMDDAEVARRLSERGKTLEGDLLNPVRARRALERLLDGRPPLKFKLPAFKTLKLGLEPDPAVLCEVLDVRTEEMMAKGWIEEVRGLLQQGVPANSPAFRAIGYAEISRFLNQEFDFNQLVEHVRVQTRQYAKRQRSWLRSEPALMRVPFDPRSSHPDAVVRSVLDSIQ